MKLRIPLAALLLALPLLHGVAFAQISDTDRATARALAAEGQDALDAKDYARAVDRFGRADSLFHAPTLSLGLARAQVGIGKLVTAQETYNRILREGVPANAPPVFVTAVADAKKEVDALAPRLAWVTVTVQGADAAVTIDGAPLPKAVLGVRRPIDPGKHIVTATANGFATQESTIQLGEGKTAAVELDMKAAVAPPPVPMPVPVVKPVPPPPRPPVLAPTLPAPTVIATVEPVREKPASKGSTRRTVGFVGLGVGLAGVGLGAVTGLVALGDHSTLKIDCGTGACPSADQGKLDSYHTMGLLSTIGFIAGGVGLAGGSFLLLTAPKDQAPRSAFVTPYIGPAGAGAMGRF